MVVGEIDYAENYVDICSDNCYWIIEHTNFASLMNILCYAHIV